MATGSSTLGCEVLNRISWFAVRAIPALVLLLTGCTKEDKSNAQPAGFAFDIPAISAPAAKFASTDPGYTNWWADWSREVYLRSYQRIGSKDPSWDDQTHALLEDYAHRRVYARPSVGREARQLQADLAGVVAQGCDDPLVRYLHLRLVLHNPARATPEIAAKFSGVADDLEASAYPAIIAAFAHLRAAQAWRSASTDQVPQVNQYRIRTLNHLLHTLLHDEIPIHAAYEICDELYGVLSNNRKVAEAFRHAVEPVLMARWPDEAMAQLLKGRFFVDHAWAARGGGWASTVTQEGWKLFGERLAIAETALDRAWALDPSLPGIPVQFMRLEVGQGRGRARMEQWFQRAIVHPSQRYDALEQKLWYLQPRWHGSEQDCLEAARAILTSDDFTGRCPLHLYHLHASLAEYFKKSRPDYWTEPHVWPDIQAAFERYFSLHDTDHGWRHNYVQCAYRCRQWHILHQEIAKLDRINYAFFGGREAFERMRAEAQAHAGN